MKNKIIDIYPEPNLNVLSELQTVRYGEIDTKTGELIGQGFTYQGKVFSFSTSAQANLLGLDLTRNDPALTYPITYNTISDDDTYNVVDATDMHNMFLTALGTKKAHIDSGTALKTQVRNAIDVAAVNLIIDNR